MPQITLCWIFVFLLAPCSVIAGESRSSVDPFANLENSEQGKLAARSNFVTVAPDREAFKIGTDATFHINSKVGGFLLVFDIDPAGNVMQLFPNQYSGSIGTRSTVRAGDTIIFPADNDVFKLAAASPVGSGSIVVILINDPTAWNEFLKAYGDLHVIKNDSTFQERLDGLINKMSLPSSAKTKRNLAIAEARYLIVK